MRLRALTLVFVLFMVTPALAVGRSREITWHGNQIHLYDAQPAGHSGQGIRVAVIDGWVDGKHPDFEGRVLQGADCSSGTCVAGQTRDECTHGTHVAGTVASSSFGVAPKATILPVRVLVSDGKGGCTGSPANVAAGIRWAQAHGARVLNLSLGAVVPGVSNSSDIPNAVSEAAAAGIVVVFSAGNSDLPLADSYSGNALVVAATGPSGQLASYSQHDAGVDVAAPGGEPNGSTCTQAICVTSLYPDGQYAVAAGTSMAAPHVSGIAALLLAQQPSRSRQSVFDRIKGTAHALAGAGAGLVDARAALGAPASAPRPTSTSTRAPVVVAPVERPVAKRPVVKRPVATVKPTVRPTVRPTTTPAAVSSSSPSPAPTTAPVSAEPLVLHQPTEVPVGLATLAGVLAGLGALSVGLVSLRGRRPASS